MHSTSFTWRDLFSKWFGFFSSFFFFFSSLLFRIWCGGAWYRLLSILLLLMLLLVILSLVRLSIRLVLILNKDFIAFFRSFHFGLHVEPLFYLLRLFIYSCTLQFISFPFAMLCCPILMMLTKKPVCDFGKHHFLKHISCCSIS